VPPEEVSRTLLPVQKTAVPLGEIVTVNVDIVMVIVFDVELPQEFVTMHL
jgi:hypothetical protein